MKFSLSGKDVFSLFAVLLSVAFIAFSCPAFCADPIAEEAKLAKKPLIADFGMTRCASCIEEAKVMERLKAEIGDKAIFRFIHVGKEEQTAADCKILMIPAIVFYDKEGREVFRNVGFMDFDAVMKKITETRLLD